MSRFLAWTDLHCEHAPFLLPDRRKFSQDFDFIALAGDTDSGRNCAHLEFARRVVIAYDRPVVMVRGNHEYWGLEMADLHAREAAWLRGPRAIDGMIFLLDGEAVTINETRVIGATLWSDPARTPLEAIRARQTMNDYLEIRLQRPDGSSRFLAPQDLSRLHQRDWNAMRTLLETSHPGGTVVLSHHAPMQALLRLDPQTARKDPNFAAELDAELPRFDFDVWLYGHTHRGREFSLRDRAPADPLRIITL